MIGSKGSMLDIFVVLIILFGAMIAIVIGAFVSTSIYDDPTVNGTLSVRASNHILNATTILRGFDGLMAVLLFGAGAASIISAFLIRSHPAFFAAALIFQLIMIGISGVFTNVYETLMSNAYLAATANQFPIFAAIIAMYPLIMLGISALIAIVMYGKASGGEQYAY